MKPETRFRQNKVLPFLRKLKNTKRFPIQQSAISGTPDFLLCIYGRFVALELKDSGEKPTKLQEFELEGVRNAGGVSLVADPDNWDAIKRFLTTMSETKENAWK